MLLGKCLHEIFQARARAAPDHIAVCASDQQITYGDLDARSDRIARRLKSHGVGPDAIVGLCVDRSIEMIVGLLAILKAGGAYLPIDPMYPSKRIQFLLNDGGVNLVVAVSRATRCLEECDTTVLCIDDDDQTPAAALVNAKSIEVSDKNLAYVIYTSGSTGTPKGVLIEHRNAVRLFEQTSHWFLFDEHDVWTNFHSISFDFSVWEIWGALLYGGRLVIVPSEVTRSPEQFHALLREYEITVLNQTPSAFRQLVAADMDRSTPSEFNLRLIVFGGEALDINLVEPWIARYGDQRHALVNMYGITETTVHVTYKRILKEDLDRPGLSLIGVPIPDLEIFLLDDSGHPAQDGTPGEIYIAGAGLARGYLNLPDVTAQCFSQMPNAESEGTRLYYSGDRAVRMPNGELAYLGRSDDQMKVRGFRIEPKEIESCLRSHPEIETAIVIPHDYGDGDVRLLAYVIPRRSSEPGAHDFDELTAELTSRAAEELPLHMRPSAYFVVYEIPMTAHGKADRDALRQLALRRRDFDADVLASMTPTEKVITDIWEEVLQRKGIKTGDDFFDLGGTSLALTRIFARVNQHFSVSLNGSALVEEASVARLASCVDAQLKSNQYHASENRNAGYSGTSSVFS